jgi:hypothetical protein
LTDVLTITVPLLDGHYASKNAEGRDGFRGGRKSEVYKRVFKDTKTAAEAAIVESGWTMADCECFASIILFFDRRARRDALNIGTAEANALTAAGVWVDDNVANPPLKWIRYDPDGQNRIVITVVKLHRPWKRDDEKPRASAASAAERRHRPCSVDERREEPAQTASSKRSPIIGSRTPTLNGKPITASQAREFIENGTSRKARRA